MTTVELIVIGGSAGALEPLLAIFGDLPDELTIPIVVVMHLPPTRPSLIPDLAARVCRRPVQEAEDKLAMQQSTIYVAPPNYHVLIERDRSLSLSTDPPVHFSRPSIDVLFESAADSLGRGVAGLVLSGASEDGARGLRRIHDVGGTAIVQDPATASCSVMPAAARSRVGPDARVLAGAELTDFLAALGGVMVANPGGSR